MPQRSKDQPDRDRRDDTRPKTLFKRLIRHSSILMTGKGMNALFSLGYTALAVRALGVEGFGLLILIHTYAQLTSEFTKFQGWQAILRFGTVAFRNGDLPQLRQLIVLTAVIDLVGATIGTLIALAGVALLGPTLGWSDDLLPAAALYMLSVFIITPSTPLGLLRMWGRFDQLAVRSALGSFTRLIGAAILLPLGGDLRDFLIVWFIATLVSSLLLIAAGWREAVRHRVFAGAGRWFRLSARPFPGIWRLLWTTHFNGAVAMGTFRMGTLMVGGFLGPAEAGLYRIATQIAEIAGQPGKLLTPAIYPELAKLVADNELRRMRVFLLRSVLLSLAVGTVLFAVVWLAGTPLLRLIGGDIAIDAFDTLLLLTAAGLVLLVFFPFEPTLISVGREGAALRSRLLMAAVYLPVLVVFIEQYGLEGAAIALIVAHIVAVLAQGIQLQRWFAKRRRAAV